MKTEDNIEKLAASPCSDRSCVCGAKDSPTHATDPGCWWCGRAFGLESDKQSSEGNLDINGKSPSDSLWTCLNLAERMRRLECPFEMQMRAENYQWSKYFVESVSNVLIRWKEAGYPDPKSWLETQSTYQPPPLSLPQEERQRRIERRIKRRADQEGSLGDEISISQNAKLWRKRGRTQINSEARKGESSHD